jgi:hypothetical protein
MRLLRYLVLLSVVGLAAPAFACHDVSTGRLGVQVGHLFLGFTKHRRAPCPAVVLPPAAYAPPPVVYAPPPVVYAPPPVVYTPPPVVYAPVPVPVAAPAVRARPAPPPAPERPGFLAIKYLPGVATGVSVSDVGLSLAGPAFAHSPGLELRFTRWFSLRSDLEFRRDSRTWDVLGAKVSLFPDSPVKPYASVSFAATELLATPGRYAFGIAGAGGLDVFFGRHFFLEAEVRYRVMPGAGDCCGEVPSVTGVVGGGVAFF